MFPTADMVNLKLLDNERAMATRASERAVRLATLCCDAAGDRHPIQAFTGLISRVTGLISRVTESVRTRLEPAAPAGPTAPCCAGTAA